MDYSTAKIVPARISRTEPSAYRLARKIHGDGLPDEYVLQGRFDWQQGNEFGSDWCDLQTVEMRK